MTTRKQRLISRIDNLIENLQWISKLHGLDDEEEKILTEAEQLKEDIKNDTY